jgi:hypothetical protein
MAATSQAQTEATKAAQLSRCCSTESTSTSFRYQGAGSIDNRHEGENAFEDLGLAAPYCRRDQAAFSIKPDFAHSSSNAVRTRAMPDD